MIGCLRWLGDFVVIDVAGGAVVECCQASRNLVEREPGEVEIELRFLVEPMELGPQELVVPTGVFGNPVVGDAERPRLRLAQMLEADHRHGLQLQLSGGQQPAVAGDQHPALVHQAGRVEAEGGDRARDLRHLIVGVRACIGGVGQQPVERPVLDREFHQAASAMISPSRSSLLRAIPA